MFKRHDSRFKKLHVQGLDCYLPPPGYVYDHFTGKVVFAGVHERSKEAKAQYWEPTKLPRGYAAKRDAEELIQRKDPKYFDDELESLRRREWFRRMNGFWFMNNGKPVYVTGLHYFTLCYWEYDIGLPHFRWTDAKKFYFLQYCVEDPDCMGMLEFARRRSGKSYMASAFLYEGASRTNRAICGIQSKNESDAEDFFLLHVVEPFKKLPHFFVPEYDRAQGDSPKKELRFFQTSRQGEIKVRVRKPSLKSRINFKAAQGKAYDGKKLKFYVRDEFGKGEDVDMQEAHKQVKYCFLDGPNIIGKAIYTTTVEDMSNGRTIRDAKALYDKSDPAERDANNRTGTLMYRYVTFANESLYFDRYGYPLVGKADQHLDNEFQKLIDAGDFRSLASEQRKNPRTIAEIFKVAATAPLFNIVKLQNQLSEISWKKNLYETGNFVWVGGKRDGQVKFVPAVNGRFAVRLFLNNGSQDLRRPKNKHIFAIGCDPFDHKNALDPSNGAAYCLKKWDENDPVHSNSPIFEYCARPTPNVFFEDMVKACVYYGSEILVENNKSGLINYFEDRGYGEFLKWWEGQLNPGIYAGDRSKQRAAEAVDMYVEEHCGKINFPRLLEDMMVFDLGNSTKNDCTMAFGWTLMAAGSLDAERRSSREETVDITRFFKTYRC